MTTSHASRRTRLPRQVKLTKSFVKDWRRLSRSGRYDMPRLKRAMRLIADNDAPLPPEWKDHALKGQWSNHRECHVGGDFLLVYRIDDSLGPSGTVAFIRTGTHNELFK